MSRRLVALGICLVLAAVAVGCGKKEVRGPSPGAWYVAIGDSGTSGAMIAPVADAGCVRSKINYPSLLAKQLDVPSFADVSCGGAKTQNVLTKKQDSKTAGLRALQISAVTARTRLVTVGIGLNDFGLSYYLLYQCLEVNGEVSEACRKYLETPEAGFGPFLDGIDENVEKVIEAVRKKAPKATVVLVGYPRYAPDTGSCPERMPMPAEAVDRARTVLAEVSERYRAVAEKTGALYADMYAASKGHDVCSADPWVHGVLGSRTEGAQLHPYPAYHQAVAEVIERLLRSAGVEVP